MEHRPTLDLVQILNAGGGIEVDATFRPTLDLVQMASAAGMSGANLILRGMNHRPTLDMVQIANASRGKVIFSA